MKSEGKPVAKVKVGAVTIPIYFLSNKSRYLARWTDRGKRREIQGVDLEKLRVRARAAAKAIATGTVDFEKLPRDQLAVVSEVIRRGITLADLDRIAAAPAPKNLQEVIDAFLAAKASNAGGSERHTRTLTGHLKGLAKSIGKRTPVATITPEQVDSWLGQASNPRTRKNWRASAINLFRWARDRDYLPQDRRTAPERSERPKQVVRPIEIWTPAQLKVMLESVSWDYLPWLAIQAFAGVRSSELCPEQRSGSNKPALAWENVWLDRDNPQIEIPAATSKTGRRRLIPICDTLAAWLAPLHKGTGLVCPAKSVSRRNHGEETEVEKLSAALKVPWKGNANRHSFGTYRCAQTQSVGQVAIEMGNSESMCKAHYLEAVTLVEAEDWFSITPVAVDRALQAVV